MTTRANKKSASYLFLAGGVAFLAAAIIGHQVTFCGAAVAFAGIGASFLMASRAGR